MKKQFIKMCAVVFSVLLCTVISAQAQAKQQLEIEIPFDFMVKGRELPAGKYVVVRLTATNPDVLVLKNTNGKAKVVMLTQRTADASANQTSLIFNRYGETRFLSAIQLAGEKTGSQILAGDAERKLRRQKAEPILVRLTPN